MIKCYKQVQQSATKHNQVKPENLQSANKCNQVQPSATYCKQVPPTVIKRN